MMLGLLIGVCRACDPVPAKSVNGHRVINYANSLYLIAFLRVASPQDTR